jgi:ketosteroid isomerase-like protein
MSHIKTVETMLRAIETGDEAALRSVVDPAIMQRELPNKLMPNGAERDLAAVLAGFASGKRVVREQRYQVKRAIEQGDHVAVEVHWSARLQVPVLGKQPGDLLEAAFAIFVTLKDGRIVAQTNYDCFLP